MSSDEVLKNWRKLKDDLFAQANKPVAAFVIIAIQENGEVLWGSDFSLDPKNHAELEKWISAMKHCLNDVKKMAARKEKKNADDL